MRKSITFINWDGMGNTITRIQNNTGGSTRCIQGKNSLDSNIHSWGVEGFKHNLSHLFSVSFWVKRSFITDIGIFLSHTDHNTGMSWATNNRWENSTWSIISSETGFAHSGTVINNKGLNFVVTHFLSNRPPC